MKILLRQMELCLTLIGVVVVLAVALAFTGNDGPRWRAMALVATSVGVVHGIIFWSVRRHQRLMRRAALQRAQGLLNEIVANRLVLMEAISYLRDGERAHAREACAQISISVTALSDALLHVSHESLQGWSGHYLRERSRP